VFHEIAYALDTLKADGIGLLTSYGDKWLGDPAFAPVMEELNRRKAIVYTHPTTASCCGNLIPDVPDAIVEWGTDTTRTIAGLVSGTAARCRDVTFIFSHGGGTMPFLAERFQRLPQANPKVAARLPGGVDAELRRFYYDTAQAAHPYARPPPALNVPRHVEMAAPTARPRHVGDAAATRVVERCTYVTDEDDVARPGRVLRAVPMALMLCGRGGP